MALALAATATATAGAGFAVGPLGQVSSRAAVQRSAFASGRPSDRPSAHTEATSSRVLLSACAGFAATVVSVAGRACRYSSGRASRGSRRGELSAVAARGGAEAGVAMPPVWVINLDKSVDRWNMCQEEFAKQGVKGERFPACLGKALSEEELQEKVTWGARYFCSYGMIGCFMSHIGCWKKVVEEDHDVAIVLEDDIVLFDNFEDRVKATLQELPDDWDVCLLGAVGCVDRVKEALHMQLFGLITGGHRKSPGKTRSVSENLFVPFKPAGTHAYMVSKRGAAKMLARNPKPRYHVDITAWSQQDLNLYMVKDELATQRFDSDTTVSKAGEPATERFLRWLWTVSGLGAMATRAGVPNLTWAWKIACFALPLFGRRIIVEMGPASCMFVLACLIAIATRNLKLLGFAFAYWTIMVTMIRALAGNFKIVPIGSLVLATSAMLYLGW